MIGRILATAHKAFYAFGQWWACDLSDDVATKAFYSQQQWDRFQAYFKRQEKLAQARHGRVEDVRKRRTDILHASMGLRHGR